MRARSKSVSKDVEDAFERYVEECQGQLIRLAFLLTSDAPAAEQLTRAALIALHKTWPTSRHRPDLDLYVRGLLLDQYPIRPGPGSAQAVNSTPSATTTAPVVVADPASQQVWTVIQDLPPMERLVTVLRYFDRQPVRAIAGLLNVSSGQVAEAESRARAALDIPLAAWPDRGLEWDSPTGSSRWSALKSLPARQQDIVLLRYFDGLSTQEVARQLGLDVETVIAQESLARSTLRESARDVSEQPDEGAA
jgi:DNA-directed RNA polymerase specialized sigma24 family protein